jgi:hypothetical protein
LKFLFNGAGDSGIIGGDNSAIQQCPTNMRELMMHLWSGLHGGVSALHSQLYMATHGINGVQLTLNPTGAGSLP